MEFDPVIAIALVIVYIFFRFSIKPDKFPPGPRKLPLVGSLPYFYKRKSLIHNVKDLVEEFGPICGFFLGSKKAVIIADYDMLKEVFTKEEASHRAPIHPKHESRPGWWTMDPDNDGRPPGVLFSGGPYWKEMRRFMLRNLKDFGFGKASMESMIQEEVAKLCTKLSELPKGHPVDLNRTMNVSIINALWLILVGEKLELDDPKLYQIIQFFDHFVRTTTGPVSPLIEILPHPSMAKLPVLRSILDIDTVMKSLAVLRDFIEPYIVDHLKSLDPENVRDFLDVMLVEVQNATEKTSCFHGKKGYYAVFNGMIDLFLAGMETTSTSLMWTFLYMVHHPEIQAKIQQELDEVVGRNRFPTLDDRPKLHYLNAVLQESFRTASLVGAGIPHYTTKDIQVGEYVIPKDTIVIGSLYNIMNDPKTFSDPHAFNPDRFLDESGQFVHNDRVTPFGVGKRLCLGQSLAEKEFYLFCAGILQQFEMEAAADTRLPSYNFNDSFPTGIIRSVPGYQVVLKSRLRS